MTDEPSSSEEPGGTPDAEDMVPAVDVHGVSYSYGDTPALEDVCITVPQGDFLGIIGPNGSGKTTLLKIILGLEEPDSGSVEIYGEDVSDFDGGERIGYVSQQASGRGHEMPVKVREAVEMGRYPHAGYGRLREEDHDAVDDAIEKVEVDDIADRRMSALSGGQRQRVYIARALAGEADLLALDEPAVGVDAESRERFYGLLESLNDQGITIILVEHDIGVVTEHADHVACVNRRIYHHGDTASFVASDAVERAYGGSHQVIEHDH